MKLKELASKLTVGTAKVALGTAGSIATGIAKGGAAVVSRATKEARSAAENKKLADPGKLKEAIRHTELAVARQAREHKEAIDKLAPLQSIIGEKGTATDVEVLQEAATLARDRDKLKVKKNEAIRRLTNLQAREEDLLATILEGSNLGHGETGQLEIEQA